MKFSNLSKTPAERRLTIVTGEGMFVADTLTADLTFHANGTVATTWDDIAQFAASPRATSAVRHREAGPLRVEHENFRDAVLGKEADIVTLAQGARVVEVCEAMIESARTNRFIATSG